MEDLDLDELDQAVNKMMTKPQAKRGHKKPANPTVPTAPGAEPQGFAVAAAEPKPAEPVAPSAPAPRDASSTSVPVSRPMPKVPPRRRMHPGAMDIIQPNTPKMGVPSSTPTRTGRDITPVQPVQPEPSRPAVTSVPTPPRQSVGRNPEDEAAEVADEVLAALTLQDQPAHMPSKPADTPAPKPAPVHKADSSWPDPLDFHDLSDAKEKEEPDDTPPETAPTMEPKRADPDDLMDAAATSTPFVKTKVEKRPLGAYANTPAPTPLPEKPEPEEVSLTDEAPSKGEMAAAAIKSNQHLDSQEDTEPDMNKLRNMSIPQQYHTAEQKPNEEVHNLFDTKEYHAAPQQIAHPAKKGGSAWFVIMVVVLLVLLVAAVVIGYLMMSGTLDITKIW